MSAHPFKQGDKVRKSSGHTGVVVCAITDKFSCDLRGNSDPFKVHVKWDKSGISYRSAVGLEKLTSED